MQNIKNQIIDVNLNRLSEALKVIEDLTRFYFKDQKVLRQIRKSKQALWKKMGALRKSVVACRQSQKDFGRKISFDINKRGNLVDVFTVNCKRGQEAARVLEELCKSINAKQVGFFKSQRFLLYDWEKRLLGHIKSEFEPQLYVIMDIKTIGRKHLTNITNACLQHGATAIQLRETENATTRQWLTSARQIQNALHNARVKFIINNRIDICLATNADGVHLGQSDMPIRKARELLGEEKIIGLTVKNIKQAKHAEKNRADYIGFGAIFPTQSKPDIRVVGIKKLRQIIKAVKIPVVAIGGINRLNIRRVIRTKPAGVAVISAVFERVDFSKPKFHNRIITNLRKLKPNLQPRTENY